MRVKMLKSAATPYGFLSVGMTVDLPENVAREWLETGLAGEAGTNMSTLEDGKAGVDTIQSVGGEPRIFSHIKKRGPKPKELPEALIKRWAEEGLGGKAIASRLESELGVKISYKTIQRLLSGKRKNGESQHVQA
jgi:hypothetical protein